MSDESTVPPLRLVTPDDEHVDAPAQDDQTASASNDDPLSLLVQRIEDLPLRERPAAFERLNANLVAELNALEEV
jgi:hypothetical protein